MKTIRWCVIALTVVFCGNAQALLLNIEISGTAQGDFSGPGVPNTSIETPFTLSGMTITSVDSNPASIGGSFDAMFSLELPDLGLGLVSNPGYSVSGGDSQAWRQEEFFVAGEIAFVSAIYSWGEGSLGIRISVGPEMLDVNTPHALGDIPVSCGSSTSCTTSFSLTNAELDGMTGFNLEMGSLDITSAVITPVPLPAAFWLLASTLAVLGSIKRRDSHKKAA